MASYPARHDDADGMVHALPMPQVFDAASPSVVSIINFKAEGGAYVPEGVGTGIVWAGNYIVSNYHCIAKVDKGLIPQASGACSGWNDRAHSYCRFCSCEALCSLCNEPCTTACSSPRWS